MKTEQLDEVTKQTDPLKQSIELNRILIDYLKQHTRAFRLQWIIFILGFAILILVLGCIAKDNAKLYDLLANSEIVVEEVVTSTTTYDQEVSGEEANIINGNLYKDNATHRQEGSPNWHEQSKE